MPQFKLIETSDVKRVWYIDAKDEDQAYKMYWGDLDDTSFEGDSVYMQEPHEEEISQGHLTITEVK